VRDALVSGGVVHIAAHGTHEPQSPWFSSLHMADGPVFAHELPRPATAPHVVLSACDVGRLDPRPGDEPLGLTAALLALGVRSVVAPVAPVSDVVAEQAMVAYHHRLASGRTASEALAETLAEHPAAGAFCLFGTDWRPDPSQIQRAGSLNIAS
jgi:CHAT domain-containing protein